MINILPKKKKAQTTIFIFVMVIGLFVSIVLLLVGGIASVRINNALNQNISLGNVNLATINAQTFGIFTTTYLNSADWWGIAAIFGMIIGLFLSSYLTRGRVPKWGIIIDVFIIVTIFIFSLYLSSTYQMLIDALAGAGETFLEDYAPKTSMFILNLPIFIVVIGAIMMILFHSSIPKKSEEQNVMIGGYPGI